MAVRTQLKVNTTISVGDDIFLRPFKKNGHLYLAIEAPDDMKINPNYTQRSKCDDTGKPS